MKRVLPAPATLSGEGGGVASSRGASGTSPRNFDWGGGNSVPVARTDAVAPGIEPRPPAMNEQQLELRLDGGCFPAPAAPSRFRRRGGYPMPFHTVLGESLPVDNLQVVVEPRGRRPRCATPPPPVCTKPAAASRTPSRRSSALPDGLRPMTDRLRAHGVTAAAMEGTGVYWKAPFEALQDAGIHAALFPCPGTSSADSRQEDRRQRQPVAGSHLPVRPRPAELCSPAALPPIEAVDPLPP